MLSSGLTFCTILWNNFCNGFYRIWTPYKYESEKTKENYHNEILFNIAFLFLMIYVNSISYLYLGNSIWALFILDITFYDYLIFLGNVRRIINLVLNVIRIPQFFKILKYIFFLLISKKEHKNTKKLNKITKPNSLTNKIITMLIIIFVLLLILNFAYFENLYDPKQPQLWLNDNEIIWDVSLGCENESIDQGRSYIHINISISNCFFKRYSSYSGNGGVIYVYLGSYSMNVNYSMFYNCVCSSWGGAIYFCSSDSCFRMICANSCSSGASAGGQFAIILTTRTFHVEHLSVSNCSHNIYGSYSIHLFSTYLRVDNTNSSMNNAKEGSGIRISSPSSFTSSHCTFSNNKVSDGICIYFFSNPGTISMSYANIVHNNSPSDGVVYVNGAFPMMMYCIFKNNQNTLFCVWSGSLEVSHSFIDHSGSSFSRSTTVSTSNNNSFTNTITFQLQFFNSLHCNADIPLEQRTPEDTLMNTLNEPPNNSSSANSLRLVLVSLSIFVLLISVIYVLGLIINSKQESSNMSSSKSDGNVLETV